MLKASEESASASLLYLLDGRCIFYLVIVGRDTRCYIPGETSTASVTAAPFDVAVLAGRGVDWLV